MTAHLAASGSHGTSGPGVQEGLADAIFNYDQFMLEAQSAEA